MFLLVKSFFLFFFCFFRSAIGLVFIARCAGLYACFSFFARVLIAVGICMCTAHGTDLSNWNFSTSTISGRADAL